MVCRKRYTNALHELNWMLAEKLVAFYLFPFQIPIPLQFESRPFLSKGADLQEPRNFLFSVPKAHISRYF